MDIAELLAFSHKQGASDLHISAGLPPLIRVDGDIKRINVESLEDRVVHEMIYDIMNDKQQKDYEEFLETDFAFELPGIARYRVNAFNQQRGPAAAFRTIPSKVLSLEQLNAPEIFKKISSQPRGLVLVTGPTGSGKSTTLAAMVNYINEERSDHILTVEDPIEFVHTSKSCLVNQREVGTHTLGFPEALRSALREDPDIILVGELRDLETIRLALTAAETGHLVFGTLHTTSAAKTIDRIVGVLGISRSGIEYDSLDGRPVNVVMFLLGNENKPDEHIKVLRNIAVLLNNPEFYEQLVGCTTAEQVTETIIEFEETEENE